MDFLNQIASQQIEPTPVVRPVIAPMFSVGPSVGEYLPENSLFDSTRPDTTGEIFQDALPEKEGIARSGIRNEEGERPPVSGNSTMEAYSGIKGEKSVADTSDEKRLYTNGAKSKGAGTIKGESDVEEKGRDLNDAASQRYKETRVRKPMESKELITKLPESGAETTRIRDSNSEKKDKAPVSDTSYNILEKQDLGIVHKNDGIADHTRSIRRHENHGPENPAPAIQDVEINNKKLDTVIRGVGGKSRRPEFFKAKLEVITDNTAKKKKNGKDSNLKAQEPIKAESDGPEPLKTRSKESKEIVADNAVGKKPGHKVPKRTDTEPVRAESGGDGERNKGESAIKTRRREEITDNSGKKEAKPRMLVPSFKPKDKESEKIKSETAKSAPPFKKNRNENGSPNRGDALWHNRSDSGRSVKVHIGRIEVKQGVSKTPQVTTPAQASFTPAMSLDAYLNRRNGG